MYYGLSSTEMFTIVAGLVMLFWSKELADVLRTIVSRFRGGGGPGSPSHPLPANDSRLLKRRLATRPRLFSRTIL
jgi:hypothetical protein